MAATTATTTDFHIHIHLKKLFEQLHSLHQAIQKKKLYYEFACRDCRQLLRPWEIRKKEEVQVDEKKQDSKKTDQEEDIPEEEKQGLAMLNKVLVKAEKARQIQAKLNKPETKISKGKHELLKKSIPPNIEPVRETEKTVSADEVRTKIDRVTVDSSSNYSQKGSKIVSSHPKSSRTISSAGIKPKERDSDVQFEAISQSKLDRILDSRIKSTKVKAPVFAKAPYQTMEVKRQPRVQRSSAKTTNSRQTEKFAGSQHKKKSEKLLPVRNSSKINSMKMNQQSHSATESKVQKKLDHEDIDVVELSARAKKVSISSDAKPSGEDLNVISEKFNSLNVKEEKTLEQKDDIHHHHQRVHDVKSFNLQTQGNTLSVPVKFKKAYIANRSLRKKLYNSRLVKKMEVTSPRQQFLDRIQDYIESNSDPCGETVQNVKEYTRLYEKLMEKLDCLDSTTLNELSSWDEILKMKKTMEYVFSTFCDAEQSYQYLSKAAENMNAAVTAGLPVSRKTRNQPLWQWLPEELGCLPSDIMSGDHLRYHNLQQLLHHTTLLHEVQLHQMQQWIQSYVRSEILSQMKVQERPHIQLYRGIYSLVCCNGGAFPAIVADTIVDNEET